MQTSAPQNWSFNVTYSGRTENGAPEREDCVVARNKRMYCRQQVYFQFASRAVFHFSSLPPQTAPNENNLNALVCVFLSVNVSSH